MTEEQAVFDLGKRLSALRNGGDDLSTEPVLVGKSMGLPDELADEHDRHFPPGPRRFKRLTEKVFRYELTYQEIGHGGYESGVIIRHAGQSWDLLKNARLFTGANKETLEQIESTRCNRYDIIPGMDFTFVIDKLDEAISVTKARYFLKNLPFCEEHPVFGETNVYLEGTKHRLSPVNFPFVPFSEFWTV